MMKDVTHGLVEGIVFIFLVTVILGVVYAITSARSLPEAPVNWTVGEDLTVELPKTRAEFEKGLAGRSSMPPDHGMLFAYAKAGIECMWAKDMRFDLSVAFLDEHGVIINVEDMAAGSREPHCSTKPALYVLEMNKGWFATHQLDLKGLP